MMNWMRTQTIRRFIDEISPYSKLHLTGKYGRIAGNIAALSRMKNTIILLHSPVGCGYLYRNNPRLEHPYYTLHCTAMDERDVILGCGEKLEELIETLIRTETPDMIVVLPSACSEMVSSDIAMAVASFSNDPRCHVIGVTAECFSHMNDRVGKENLKKHIADYENNAESLPLEIEGCGFGEVLTALAEQLAPPRAKRPHSINIESCPWDDEVLDCMKDTFQRAGVEVLSLFPRGTVEDLACASSAQLNVLTRPRWGRRMKERFGTELHYINSWVDFFESRLTDKMYQEVADKVGRSAEMRCVLENDKEQAEQLRAVIRQAYAGKRIVLCSRAPLCTAGLIRACLDELDVHPAAVIVHLNKQNMKDNGTLDLMGDAMYSAMFRAIEATGYTGKIIDLDDSEAVTSCVQGADYIFDGKVLIERYPDNEAIRHAKLLPGMVQLLPVSTKFKAEMQHAMLRFSENAVAPEDYILARIPQGFKYYPLADKQNTNASITGWQVMWNEREKADYEEPS